MADINTRKRGNKWEYYFEIAKIDGKRKRISKGGFSTKSEAVKAGSEAYNEYNNSGQKFVPSEISMNDYLNHWLETYCTTNLKESTLTNYRKRIRLHIIPKIGKYKLKDITPVILQEVINDMYKNGYSRNTLAVIKGILSNSFNYAVQPLGYIKSSPMLYVKIPKSNNKLTRTEPHVFIDQEHINMIFERFPKGSTAHIPLLLGYKCGLRLGEAFAITWEDIDFNNSTMTISKQLQWDDKIKMWYITPPKYNSVRTIDIDNELLELLQETKEHQEKAKEYYNEYYTTLYIDNNNYINESNGTPIHFINVRENGGFIQPRIMQHTSSVIHRTFPEFDFHSLRHTHCTMLIENNIPLKYIQERLGHKNIKVTMDIYNHITESQKLAGKEMIDNMFK